MGHLSCDGAGHWREAPKRPIMVGRTFLSRFGRGARPTGARTFLARSLPADFGLHLRSAESAQPVLQLDDRRRAGFTPVGFDPPRASILPASRRTAPVAPAVSYTHLRAHETDS